MRKPQSVMVTVLETDLKHFDFRQKRLSKAFPKRTRDVMVQRVIVEWIKLLEYYEKLRISLEISREYAKLIAWFFFGALPLGELQGYDRTVRGKTALLQRFSEDCFKRTPQDLPQWIRHTVRSTASCFVFQYPFIFLTSSSSCLRLLPRHFLFFPQYFLQ